VGNSGRVLCTRERVPKAKKTRCRPFLRLVAEADPAFSFSFGSWVLLTGLRLAATGSGREFEARRLRHNDCLLACATGAGDNSYPILSHVGTLRPGMLTCLAEDPSTGLFHGET
jgi:hypothetical protein